MGGTGGGKWGHLQGAVHMVAARLCCERAMVGTRWTTSHLTVWKDLENTTLTL